MVRLAQRRFLVDSKRLHAPGSPRPWRLHSSLQARRCPRPPSRPRLRTPPLRRIPQSTRASRLSALRPERSRLPDARSRLHHHTPTRTAYDIEMEIAAEPSAPAPQPSASATWVCVSKALN